MLQDRRYFLSIHIDAWRRRVGEGLDKVVTDYDWVNMVRYGYHRTTVRVL